MPEGNSRSYPNHKHSFTLVELMLVITIMAILAGTMIPNFRPFLSGATIKHASKTLANIIRFTRSVAVQRSVVTKITFDLETGNFLVSAENDPISSTGVFEPVRLPIYYPNEYREKVKIAKIEKQLLFGNEQANEILFQPDGTSSDTFLYMVDEQERIYTIGIVGLTGLVMEWSYATQSFYAP